MSEPDFNRRVGTLVIQGVGLIGGSLGMAARRYGLADRVIGVGRRPERLEKARQLGAIDSWAESSALSDACAGADIIVLCTPVSKICRDLPEILAVAGPNAAITDVGSVKTPIVAAAGGDPRFVGSHPMAGSELAGVEAARVNLFQEATWALTPTESTSPRALSTIRGLAQGVGANTRILTPELHDEAVAVTSHLPHVIAYALMSLSAQKAAGNPDIPYMTAGSFAGATRVAGSLPSLWKDIAVANADSLAKTLAQYRALLDEFQKALESADGDALEALFQAGYDARASWPGR